MAANLILCKGKTADNPYRMEEAGLVRDEDFVNGFDFLPNKFNSYPVVKAM